MGLGAVRWPAVEAIERRLLFATFVVSNLNDSGAGSLRQAILNSNATPGVKDAIDFSINAGAIQLRSPLPAITSPVRIDTTHPDSGTAIIEIDGSGAGPDAHGLMINTSPIPADVTATEVTGLALYRFGGDGVRINGSANLLDRVFIGTDATGATAFGNSGRGVRVQGGDNAVSNTTIAFNGDDGIAVLGGVGNDLSYNNSIFSNGGLAIDLGDDGPTPNDRADADAGPNNLLNAPVLTAVTDGPGGTTVWGTVTTTPETGVLVALYANDTPDPEGRRFLGSVEGVTGASGTFTFEHLLPSILAVKYVTATATAFGDGAAVGTSEFSHAVTFAAPPRVARVWVSGTAWTSAGRLLLQTTGGGSATNGWPIRDGASQSDAVPCGNVDRVSIQFTEHVNVSEVDLSVIGVNLPAYAVSGIAYDRYTYTATWTLSARVALDHVELNVNGDLGGVSDAEGNLLDGEWANGEDLFPSGDGTAGGNFRFLVRVAPGDANLDGTVNSSDFAILAANFGKVNRLPANGDSTGDGVVDSSDFTILAANFGRTMPAAPVSTSATVAPVPTASTNRRQPVSRAAARRRKPSPAAKAPKPLSLNRDSGRRPAVSQGLQAGL